MKQLIFFSFLLSLSTITMATINEFCTRALNEIDKKSNLQKVVLTDAQYKKQKRMERRVRLTDQHARREQEYITRQKKLHTRSQAIKANRSYADYEEEMKKLHRHTQAHREIEHQRKQQITHYTNHEDEITQQNKDLHNAARNALL